MTDDDPWMCDFWGGCKERATFIHYSPAGTRYYCEKHRCVHGCEEW